MKILRKFACIGTIFAFLLSGCGGGTSTTSNALSGTAAVGAPIVGGVVTVKCAGGPSQTTTTSSGGAWTVSMSGQTLPCVVQVSGGTVSGATSTAIYHSFALAIGNVNVTPLTDLLLAKMTGNTPQTWFASPVYSALTSGAYSAALTALNSALGLWSTLGTLDPVTSSFTPTTGNQMDNTLQAFQSALTALSQTYANLLAAIIANNFSAFSAFSGFSGFSGFSTQLSSAYAALASPGSGSGSGTGSGSCSSGQVSLTYGGTNDLFTQGQVVCFTGSATSLSYPGKTLASPTAGSSSGGFSIYLFTDGIYTYEEVLNNGALYEINLLKNGTFIGGFN